MVFISTRREHIVRLLAILQSLREARLTATLGAPDFSKEFILQTDAFNIGLGGCPVPRS
ncbi:UNVERIFIED_CONTAM: hypothetical protein FKN15_023000 [Acipenser sinensis]